MLTLQLQKSEAEEGLRKLNEDIRLFEEELIPDALQNAGLDDIKLNSGVTVSTKQRIFCSVAKNKNPRSEEAIGWLMAQGYGGMVKRKLIVAYNEDQVEDIKRARAELEARYGRASVKTEHDIHASTLKATITKFYSKGVEFPEAAFNASAKTVAVVKSPKSKKETL